MPVLNDPKQEGFCRFVAQGKSKREAAVLAGYSKHSASAIGSRLAKKANVSQRIAELSARVADKVIEKAVAIADLEIASRTKRVQLLDDYAKRLRQVFDARAADPTMKGVPGASTGLIVRQIKVVGTGAAMKAESEYVVDTGSLRELRAHAQQAAVETGQWQNNDADGKPVSRIEYKWIDADQSGTEPEGRSTARNNEIVEGTAVQ